MPGALDDEPPNLSTFFKNTKNSRKETHDELRSKHAGKPQDKLNIYDSSFFNIRWTVHVLNHAFGLELMNSFGDEGRDMTFTPYNGSASDKNRFSWTLRLAILLASENLKDLEQTPIRAPAPAGY